MTAMGGLFDDEQFLLILVLYILLAIVGAGSD
ncbi:MAG: YjcZ family sporulation protein [Bacillaceae bacterium]|nr:YjcZ family sporulation protein [Bacillaceae bacterium]